MSDGGDRHYNGVGKRTSDTDWRERMAENVTLRLVARWSVVVGAILLGAATFLGKDVYQRTVTTQNSTVQQMAEITVQQAETAMALKALSQSVVTDRDMIADHELRLKIIESTRFQRSEGDAIKDMLNETRLQLRDVQKDVETLKQK